MRRALRLYKTMRIQYTVRMYAIHDSDLITLFQDPRLNFSAILHSCLNAYYKKEFFVYDMHLPPREVPNISNRLKTRRLSLDSETDKDIIDMISKISSGYRNQFFKNIIRLYLFHPILPFMTETEEHYTEFHQRFNEMKESVLKNKHFAKSRHQPQEKPREKEVVQKTEPSSTFERPKVIEHKIENREKQHPKNNFKQSKDISQNKKQERKKEEGHKQKTQHVETKDNSNQVKAKEASPEEVANIFSEIMNGRHGT